MSYTVHLRNAISVRGREKHPAATVAEAREITRNVRPWNNTAARITRNSDDVEIPLAD